MKISYDKEADAMAIWFEGVKSVRTIDITEDIFVDVDEDGRLAGIEVLHATAKASLKDLLKISIDFQKDKKTGLPDLGIVK